jgi:hypothetical protein
MADIPTSGLNAITNLAPGDLLNVSDDLGGGSYESKRITAGDFDMVHGVRYYGVSTTDPTTPTPQDGDQYYNSVLDMNMYYDGGRAKWLLQMDI